MILIRDIQILTEAVKDLEAGKRFYNQQQLGIGDYFWNSLLADIESLLIHAGVHLTVNGYHRLLAKRFPYAVYYEVIRDVVRVVAILPLRRNPAWLEEQRMGRD